MIANEALLTYRDYVPDDEGREQIQRKIHFKAHGRGMVRVPPRVNPQVVHDVLLEEVKGALTPGQIRHATDVARFYRVRPVAGKFESLLQRREQQIEDFVGSLLAIAAVADLGTAEQLAAVEQYYGYILRQNFLEGIADEAIDCFFELGAGITEKMVAEAIQRRMAALRGQDDDASRDAANQLEMHLNATLPAAAEGKSQKAKLLAEADPAKRAAGLAAAYAGTEDLEGTDWHIRASYALREELEKSGDKVVVEAFQTVAAQIPTGGDAESVARMKAAISRAIIYFGGELTEDQEKWLAPETIAAMPLEG